MSFRKIFLILQFILISNQLFSQCVFNPVVTGNTLLCPNGTGILTTQVYDTYQWYKRPFSGGTAQPIAGAVMQTLNIDAANDATFYFSVAATLNGCTELSPEVLVDSWVFLLPYTIIEGDYTFGANGELVVCQGDSILLICGMPYNTNIQWYDNGNIINGANNDTLIVTTPGSFTFTGAPAVCPNFLQNQFIPADVAIINCPVGIVEIDNNKLNAFPNPVTNQIRLEQQGISEIEIKSIEGSKVLSKTVNVNDKIHLIDVSFLSAGNYFISAKSKNKQITGRFIKY